MPVFHTRRYTILCPVAINAALKIQHVARYATTTLLAILVFLLPMLFLGFQSKVESQLGHQRGLSQK